MTEPSLRWPCAKRILELARADTDLTGVLIQGPYPGDEAGPECIYLSDVDGELDVPVYKGPDYPVDYDDMFELPFEARVMGDGKTPDETMDRLHVIVSALRRVIITKVTLDGLDGVVAAVLGRDRWSAGEIRGVGLRAYAQVVVEIHTRISL